MHPISNGNFGLIIAYLLPGFVGLVGISFHSSVIATWLTGGSGSQNATFGGFLFSTLVAILFGLLCSTIRWLVLDTVHHQTGIKPPRRNFRLLQANLGAYRLIEENHYQYYQFYGNSLAAWLLSYGSYRVTTADRLMPIADLASFFVSVLLFLGSRDTLRKYYARVQALLSDASPIILDPSQLRGEDGSKGPRER